MAAITVRWTSTAMRQRNLIFEYWNERNHSYTYSKKLNSSIEERIAVLEYNPEIGKVVNFSNTRVISLGHYSLFYKHIASEIVITAFWDNRQEPSKLLKVLRDK